ncbi:uncharacterized protein B0I36DRAFT_433356 [Microdochium trichocladiopsis]|uniref:Uncharacterized protein n=1 Tax=Microdochium trichocladiopsis TaxID=1682393 RepID=A0A9P8Y0F6_9PEZI|nr:uncharacterized protein B0I36DRAFT_433356 [Microdochium trichocladiopsis]KAH7025741.1 hypothetical protein B0I36DRAFT_433356 [Microdochium trichocladiopsis]
MLEFSMEHDLQQPPRPTQSHRHRKSLSRQSFTLGRRILQGNFNTTSIASAEQDSKSQEGHHDDKHNTAATRDQTEYTLDSREDSSAADPNSVTVNSALTFHEDDQPTQEGSRITEPLSSSEEKDAEERNRPENEIDSQFGSDAGGDTKDSRQPVVRTPTQYSVDRSNDANERHERRQISFSSAESTAVNSDEDESILVETQQDIPAFSTSQRRRQDINCSCDKCVFRQQVLAAVAADTQQQRRRNQQHQQREQQDQQQDGEPLLAPLVFQTMCLAAKVLGDSIRSVRRDAENYIIDLYVHQSMELSSRSTSEDSADHDTDYGVWEDEEDQNADTSIPHPDLIGVDPDIIITPSLPSDRRSTTPTSIKRQRVPVPVPRKPVTALRAAVGLAACLAIWLFARIAVFFGPELLFGVCFVFVAILVGPGCRLVFDNYDDDDGGDAGSVVMKPATTGTGADMPYDDETEEEEEEGEAAAIEMNDRSRTRARSRNRHPRRGSESACDADGEEEEDLNSDDICSD